MNEQAQYRVAIVTGASRGIGRAIAVALGGEGYRVAINYHANRAAADEAAALVRQAGGEALLVQADIGQADDRRRLVEEAVTGLGPIELLVNNAGVAPRVRADMLEMAEESFDHVLDTNLKGPYFLTQRVANHMIEHLGRLGVTQRRELAGSGGRWLGPLAPALGGEGWGEGGEDHGQSSDKGVPNPPHPTSPPAKPGGEGLPGAVAPMAPALPRAMIVNISSISAYTASINRAEYCLAKAGVSMMTQLFAARLAEYGINVYEIRPGIIATDMTSAVTDKYNRLILEEGITPIRRWGRPEDIAQAVVAIAQRRLPFSTGEVLNVDGGFHLRRL